MQIRLTVLAPHAGHGAGRACDVLVTAPAGTALAAVASGLAAAVSGPDGSTSGTTVLYAGRERLDTRRCALGEPPLVDGAVLTLQVPGEDDRLGEGAAARLHVVAGPDAGGVHLLHGGPIRVGRSLDADVPLDDPDVSRVHCTVTVGDDGRVTVADLGSTNGTTLDGAPVGDRPVRLLPGAVLRLGESALRLTPGTVGTDALPTTPDGEGHLRVGAGADSGSRAGSGAGYGTGPGSDSGHGTTAAADTGTGRGTGQTHGQGAGAGSGTRAGHTYETGADTGTGRGTGQTHGQGAGAGSGTRAGHTHGAGADSASGPRPGQPYGQGVDAGSGSGRGSGSGGGSGPDHGQSSAAGQGHGPRGTDAAHHAGPYEPETDGARAHTRGGHGPHRTPSRPDEDATHGGSLGHARAEEALEGEGEGHSRTRRQPAAAPQGRGKRGIGAWARRLAGGKGELPAADAGAASGAVGASDPHRNASGPAPAAETWPDPAAVLLTALGPGPRLWERGPGHPESLVVRLGTTDRAELSGVPVTVGLREAGSLGLAGPGKRLAGLARSVVAQLAALHSPSELEIVLISADRNRSLEERRRAWGWLGWLPHLRPAHGQDCRLLLAYDREQADARTAELTRRLDDGPLGPGWPSADRAAVAEAAARHEGPATVVIVDGDPGSAALRETTARLAGAGAAAGIHLICLAETPAASPVSPVSATYESACAASLAFRECGAVALLSGDVATALRLLRTAGGRAAGHGTVGVVDAVSVAWAERFGRALAPLRTEGGSPRGRAATAALPRSARLLDELGLARATPASLLARWASAGDGTVVLGAGPRGPVSVDLTEEGPHLLIEGPAGSGRTELLRSIAASLAAGGRPDRLGLLLVDGAGGERGEGLAACTELPHVTEHLVASDPVRMREFAQALGAELKRRAELLGDGHFGDHRAATRRPVQDRLIGQRGPSPAESMPPVTRATARVPDARAGDTFLTDRPSGRAHRPTDDTGRVHRPTDDTGRIHRPTDDTLTDRPSGRTLRAGPEDLTYHPSGRTLRTDEGPVGDRPGPGIPRPARDDRADRPGGVSRTNDSELSDRPSGRLPRRADAGLGDGAGGRARRTGTGSLSDRPSGRTPHPGADGTLSDRPSGRTPRPGGEPEAGGDAAAWERAEGGSGDPGAVGPLPRLVVLVDDFDALVAPALGASGRPAAGSVVRALEAVARGGARLGVHLIATSARPDRTADTELAHGARLRIVLDAPPAAPGPDEPAPGRGRLGHPDGRVTPFQSGRVTGRIPRTATLRPTVVPLEWERMGDPPTRRPVRELGNGPTDLALLASALDRAARSVDATPAAPLTPAVHP
ncbi:FHA domain-containing protein [Streptomyces sp. NPDC006551]|uniref:FHA domain-containing protein n=1 Tax=Streptomyces sp. NPDC006551 TaxID=3157178 RepID=UPI0033BCE285